MQIQDEVGLYLAANQAIVKAAEVIRLNSPTFWGYGSEVCQADCGQNVPPINYSVESLGKMLAAANKILIGAGFDQPKSYAVHGWLAPAGLDKFAKQMGYEHDLTRIDASVIGKSLAEYPIGNWLQSYPQAASVIASPVQAGAIFEFQNFEDTSRRFERFSGDSADKHELFALSVSQENLFMTMPRIERTMDYMRERTAKLGQTLSFDVFHAAKSGRPLAQKVRQSDKL